MLMLRNFTDDNRKTDRNYRDTTAGKNCLPQKLSVGPG